MYLSTLLFEYYVYDGDLTPHTKLFLNLEIVVSHAHHWQSLLVNGNEVYHHRNIGISISNAPCDLEFFL